MRIDIVLDSDEEKLHAARLLEVDEAPNLLMFSADGDVATALLNAAIANLGRRPYPPRRAYRASPDQASSVIAL